MNIHSRKFYNTLGLVLLISIFGGNTFAQNNTSSPYSMFGIGTTDQLGNARNVGMGGTGIATRSSEFINMANPASYTALDSMRFYYDLGARGGYTWASTTQDSHGLIDGNISALSLATKVMDRWYFGFAVAPKSNIGYNITTYNAIEGTASEYPTFWSGAGGLSQVVLNNGIRITDWFSLGVAGKFLFGPLETSKQIVFETPASTEYTTTATDVNYYGVTGTLAGQFMHKFENIGTFTLGLTYDFKTSLKGKEEELIVHSSSKNGYVDTLHYGKDEDMYLNIPQSFGAGIAYLNNKETLTLTADYNYTKWEGTSEEFRYQNQHIFSLGAEYVANPISRRYMDRIRYRGGFKYDTGYVVFTDDTNIDDFSVSFGLGLPVGRIGNYVNIGVAAGSRGTTDHRLIQENYVQGVLSFSLSQFWYGQRKYD